MIKIVLPGKPIPKARPRFSRRGKYVATYNSQQAEVDICRIQIGNQYYDGPIEGPLSVLCWFDFERPKNHYGTGKNIFKLKKSAPAKHIVKPDIDNLIKFYLDCANKILWKDDCQIVQILGFKRYVDEAETIIIVRSLKDVREIV